MKFGKLMALELAADGLTAWPSVRYKLLKIRIEQRKEQESTLFQTGSFKKALREDLLAINAFWAERESELLRARAALHDHDDTDHHKLVRSTFKWLTLNYLAVLKISKKHDKKTHSSLLDAISKVLLTEPFVKALTSSALFADLDAPAATGDPPPVAAAASSMIVQLLGRGSERYFPHSLLSRFDAADLRLAASDVKGTLAAESDGEDEPVDEPEVTQREREASTAGQLGQLVVGQFGHHLPATARTSGEHQRLWKHKWRSKQSARDRGDAQFFEQVRADGGESERQHARIAELEQQASLAEAQAEDEEEYTLCVQYMRARLSKRRPHLEKRLAFLRSKLIVAAVDHQRLKEVMEVALAYEGRIAEQLVEAKERAAAQRVANDERRNKLRDELADSSTARRVRQIEAMKQRPGGANELVMAGLKQMVQLEHHEGRVDLAHDQERAARKADAKYEAGMAQAEARRKESCVSPVLHMQQRQAGHKKEAWEKLCVIADSESLKGVLEFWEESVDTRATLDQLENDRSFNKQFFINQLGKLEATLHDQRESNTEARKAFDDHLDAIARKHAAALDLVRVWTRRCERIETLSNDASTILNRVAVALTSAAVVERVPYAASKELRTKGRSIDEMAQALVVLSAPTVAKVARFSLSEVALETRGEADDVERRSDEGDDGDAKSDTGNGSHVESEGGKARSQLSDRQSFVGKKARQSEVHSESGAKSTTSSTTRRSRRATFSEKQPAMSEYSRGSGNGRPTRDGTLYSASVRQARIPVGVQILLGMLGDDEVGAQDGAPKRVRVREEDLLSAQATLLSGTCEFGLGVLLEQMREDVSDEALATAQPPAPALVQIDGKGQKTLSTNMRLPMHLPHRELVEAERKLAQLLHSNTAADESSPLGLTTSEAERNALRDEMRHAMQQEEARLRALEEAERAAEEAEEAEIAAEIAAEAKRSLEEAEEAEAEEAFGTASGGRYGGAAGKRAVGGGLRRGRSTGALAAPANDFDYRGVDVAGRLEMKLKELRLLVDKLGTEEAYKRANYKPPPAQPKGAKEGGAGGEPATAPIAARAASTR
eukprot:jgi/Chrpa1/28105/Chrysochromulina_OHIO_Genome00008125-RA